MPPSHFHRFQVRRIPATLSAKASTMAKSEPLRPCCGHCGDKPETLLRCSRCKVVLYCSQEHQAAHYAVHKTACSTLSRNQKTLDREDQKLRAHPGDIDTPPNAFETERGRFWGFVGTRDYMRARYAVIDTLGGINSHDAVKAQLAHVLDMLRLCYNDNLGMRVWLPPLLVRLDMDQECYNFVEWWAEVGHEDVSEFWDRTDLLTPRGRNVGLFEQSVYDLAKESPELSQLAAVALLKTKLLLDLCALPGNRSVLRMLKVPRHVLDISKPFTPRSPVITGDPRLMNKRDHLELLPSLELHVYQLYTIIQSLNPHFWRFLFNPGNILEDQPETFAQGSVEEAKLVLAVSYSAWVETPGAIEFIKARSSTDKWRLPPGIPRE